ncbi:unnamed protein product, partial [Arabidopsis halleri]
MTEIARLHEILENEVSKNTPDFDIMQNAKKDLAIAYREEEIFWKQRSHEQWLLEGDKNTNYFHNCVKFKKMKNKIQFLIDESGHQHFLEGSKGQIAVDYFRNIFTSYSP